METGGYSLSNVSKGIIMKRYDYEEDDFKDEEFPNVENEEELSEEYLQILQQRELIEAIKLQIIQKELNLTILARAVRHLEKSWFWRFKSTKTKLKLIEETYYLFKYLTDIDISEDEE